jgi:hypothetical protein
MRRIISIALCGLATLCLIVTCSDKPTGYGRLVITNAPEGPISVFISERYEHQFTVMSDNVATQVTWSVTTVGDPPVGEYAIDSTGVFAYRSDSTDAEHTILFSIQAEDQLGYQASMVLPITVEDREPFTIDITNYPGFLGFHARVSIEKRNSSTALGDFNLVIVYPARALEFLSAGVGELLVNGGWERFTYSFAGLGQSSDGQLLGFVRILATADDPATPETPAHYAESSGQLASLRFAITDDSAFDCSLLPISFAWLDCDDNSFQNASGDTMFISNDVYGWRGPALSDTCMEFEPGTQCGAWPECENNPGAVTERYVNFFGGVIEILCWEELDRMGDININGIDNEIADLILYSRYFLQSDSVFTVNKPEQIGESDVNNDGITLSVGDLEYIVRIITGDALPFPRLEPFGSTLNAHFADGSLSTDSDVDVGVIWAQFRVTGNCAIDNHTSLELLSNIQDSVLNVLVWTGTTNYDFTKFIPSGINDIFTISGGEAELIYLEASDYPGNLMTVLVQTPDGVVRFDRGTLSH